MRKKAEKKKETKASPEKTRRSNRSSRRRKKSSSSEPESEAAEVESSEEEVVPEKKRRSRSSNAESESEKPQVEAASSRPRRLSRRQAAAEEAKAELPEEEAPEENVPEDDKVEDVAEDTEVEAVPEEKESAQVGSTNGTESSPVIENRRRSESVESSQSSPAKERRESVETAHEDEDDAHNTSKVHESADDDDIVQINVEPVELESSQNDISHLGQSPELNYSPDRELTDAGKVDGYVDKNKDKARSDSDSERSDNESGGNKKSVLSSVKQVDSSVQRRTADGSSGGVGKQEAEDGRADEDGKQDSDIEELKQEVDNDTEEIAEVIVKTSAAPLPREQRKRRWGTCRTAIVETPVVISSEYLKTIIPDVKPIAEEELKFSDGKSSGDEDEEEGEIKTERESSDDELICDQEVILDDGKPAKKRDKSKDDGKKSERREKDSKDGIKLVDKSRKDSKDSGRLSFPEVNNKGKQVVRKISIVSEEAKKLARPPTPSKHVPSPVLHITNLVRPFTILQLRELLQRTGKIKEGGFWIDNIKSKCYVEFENEDQAVETRHALHDVRWPVSNPKLLHVDFAKKEDLAKAQASTSEGGGRKVENMSDHYSVNKAKANAPVREWDVGKPSFPDELMMDDRMKGLRGLEEIKLERDRDRDRKDRVRDRDREERDREREFDRDRDRKNRKEKYRRSRSPGSLEPPARRVRRKDDEAPAKLLDDLFCKTKASPCIYWLPLSSEQIAMKEEQRRKHIQELEKRMANDRDRMKDMIRGDRDRDRDGRRKDRSRDRDHRK